MKKVVSILLVVLLLSVSTATYAAGYPIVFHVHDEVVIDIRPYASNDVMLNDVCRIMKQPPAWAKDMPLDAAGWVGEFFTKD